MITRTKSPRRDGAALHGVAVLLIVVATFASFAPALHAGFVSWDDDLTVTGNYRFRGLSASHLQWMATTNHAGHYQPLSWLSLALDHARKGLTPPDFPEAAGFHATNLALHAFGAIVLYVLALRILGLGFARTRAAPGRRAIVLAAAFAALVHAVHPLRCESVCWVTERRDVLSAPFFLLAVLAYLRAAPVGGTPRVTPGWLVAATLTTLAAGIAAASAISLESAEALTFAPSAGALLPLAFLLLGAGAVCAAHGVDRNRTPRRALWLLVSLVALLVSLLAKAWGIVLPALLLVLDVWPLRRLGEAASPAAPRRSRSVAVLALLLEKLPIIVLAIGFATLARWSQVAQQGALDVWRIHTVADRVVQALYGLTFYPAKTLLPLDLAPLYPIPDDLGLTEPRFAVTALVSLALSLALLAFARRAPAALCAWVAYGVMVSPVLGLQQSGPQLVADRYAYLAGIPFAVLAGAGVAWGLQRGGRWMRATCLVAPAILLILAAATWRQSGIWRSSETLWTRAHRVAPEAALVALNLGLVLAERAARSDDPMERGALLDRALEHVRVARQRRPGMALYAMNEAILSAERARVGDVDGGDELDRAIALGFDALARTASEGLRDGTWHWHQGRMLAGAGRRAEAIAQYERAIALRPGWPPPRLALAREILADVSDPEAGGPEAALRAADLALAALEPLSGAADLSDVRWTRAIALDLRSDLLAHLGRASEAGAAREAARRAFDLVPSTHPGRPAAEQRARELAAPR